MSSSEQLRFVPDQLPVVEKPESPVANDESPVSGESVHARGEMPREESKEPIAVVKKKVEEVITGADESVDAEVTARAIRKGDVFTNPQTGEREVVEGVRKKKENGKTVWTVLFTKELKPGVRAEPGEPMRQMDFRNFEVQRQAGGYAEWTPIYEREYDDIFHDCQQVFEALAEVLEEGEQSGEELSVEALDQADAVGKLSIEAGALDDAWAAIETERNPKTAAKKLELLDQLKQIVAKLPEPWVEPHPRLKKVQEEWKQLHTGEEQATDDEAVLDGKPKNKGGRGKRSSRPDARDDVPVASRGSRSRGKVDTRVADVAKNPAERTTHASVEATARGSGSQRQKRNEEALEFEAQGARELTDREIWQQFQKYRGARYTAERWWRDRRNTLEQRIREIRMQQKDVTRMAILIDKLYKRREWGQAMRRLGPEVQQIALRESGDQVARDLALMEERKSRVLSKPVDFRKDDEELRFLYDYFFRYLAALQIGERVIASKLSKSRQRKPRAEGQAESVPDTVPVETEAETVAAEYAVATVVNQNLPDRWHEQPERVQIEVINGLRQLVAQRDMDVADAQALLTQHGVPPEEQLAIIAGGLASGFNTAVSRVLESGDLPSTPEVIEGIATGLLEQQRLTRLPYDNQES